jgi:hypothetical protein
VLLTNRTLLYNNSAPSGRSLFVAGGTVVGLLPVPAGHWIAAVNCEVSRAGCAPLWGYDGFGDSPCITVRARPSPNRLC